MRSGRSVGSAVSAGLLAFVFSCLIIQLPAEAGRPGPIKKLQRGLKNVLIAPLDIPATVSRASQQASAEYALTGGWFEGVANMLLRMTNGFAEIIGFPFPRYDVPLYDRRLGENALGPYWDKK